MISRIYILGGGIMLQSNLKQIVDKKGLRYGL